MVKDEGKVGKYYLHIKTNTVYEVLDEDVIDATNNSGSEIKVLYKNLHEDRLFVRTSEEFFDGRFLPIQDTVELE